MYWDNKSVLAMVMRPWIVRFFPFHEFMIVLHFVCMRVKLSESFSSFWSTINPSMENDVTHSRFISGQILFCISKFPPIGTTLVLSRLQCSPDNCEN